MIDAAEMRARLQAMHKKHPDSSHGDGYFNVGIRAALSALNGLAGVDTYTPCIRVTPPNMGGGWCAAHHGWFEQFAWACELASAPWVWRDRGCERSDGQGGVMLILGPHPYVASRGTPLLGMDSPCAMCGMHRSANRHAAGLDQRQVLAEAMHAAYERDPNVKRIEWADLDEAERRMWLNHAKSVLAVLDAKGVTLTSDRTRTWRGVE